MFGAQEAGACHGQVHPEHTEEQQAADGPRGRHGLSWVGTDGPREESLQLTRSPSSPFVSTALPAPQNAGRSLADRASTWDGSSPHCLRQNELKDVCVLFQDCSGQTPWQWIPHVFASAPKTSPSFLTGNEADPARSPGDLSPVMSEQPGCPSLCNLPLVQMGL